MKLFAISDLHVRHSVNRDAVESMTARPDDWLILAGDLAEKPEDIEWVFATLAPRFAKVFWVPGNHELWSGPKSDLKGVARYEHLCELAAKHGVLTPEDPPALFEGEGGPHRGVGVVGGGGPRLHRRVVPGARSVPQP